MEEVGAQVAPPIFMHQPLGSYFREPPSLSRKRDLPYRPLDFQYQDALQQRVANSGDNWNPKLWEWDAIRFVAKPLNTEILQAGTATAEQKKKGHAIGNENTITSKKATAVNHDDERLQLNLGWGLNSMEESVSRPNKKGRVGSPGSTHYPMCQVDNCKEDLSNAKDYHRRHKVCEIHSKATKALVEKQMQRFCQQCSRFHPLSEFDEGKRSCRRRLAGHNRRRRKTQSEDVTSRLLLPVNRDIAGNGNLDIVNLLTLLARTQGKNDDKSINSSPVPNRDQLVQILSKINSLPLPTDLAAKLANLGTLNRKSQDQPLIGDQHQLNGENTSSPSTVDLLAALSATLSSSSSDALANLSQRSSPSSDSQKTKSICPDNVAAPSSRIRTPTEFTSVGGERISSNYQSPVEDSECQIQETRANLPLQLFSSSPEDEGPPKLSSSRKYFSSGSSNPMEEGSPSSSPVVQKLFPMNSTTEAVKYEKPLIGRETNTTAEASRAHGSILPLELFSGSERGTRHGSLQHFPSQTGYTSSSGSDHSPPSLNSDSQDRTGRIIFKLFDKDPSHFPGTLRTQIYNWLSNSPSEMESYIRPGCVVLSIYVSMSSAAWKHLEGNLLQYVYCLLQDSDSDFWRKARFLIHARNRQLASHKDGKIRLCKSWRSCSSPELISVSPLAIVGGQETSLLVRGRNLSNPGTKIHCAYMGGYSSMEISGLAYKGATCDEVNMGGFKIQVPSPKALGRCFIEVESGFKGNSFPIIIADAAICKELRLLESELDVEAEASGIISEEHAYDCHRPRSREEALHFLNEIGWVFQRSTDPLPKSSDHSLYRFKFLLIFSVERDYCALVKVLLDILVESNLDMDGLSKESLAMLSEIQLLSLAVKRRCRNMADLLVHYSINSGDESSKIYIFPPNLEGAGGITPLHLAACTSGSDDLVDVLTNDPQEIGLNCWNSLLDANGQSPYAYAMMRNNHSYNKLVAGKYADRKNGQVSLTISDKCSGISAVQLSKISSQPKQNRGSCAKCAVVATKYRHRFPGSQGLLQRPYVHSMLAIAAVCVCVCLFMRGSPDIGQVSPFKWENLDFGTI
ncbi:squamosa promoter-binding-like protein 14 [Hibiscus syriacus]|uniref:squamosa promoter-binding-like protein 14 n=1 Tax=Hibiscus syriacus TaxID=106335 RepID=UPI00192210D2|nr:squamosa promoter-binding-like protein 14 [Hibiscus syriacus]XP_039026599.1 squamosa promoter-binding-like protein 14 [Hibiscus syriacus]